MDRFEQLATDPECDPPSDDRIKCVEIAALGDDVLFKFYAVDVETSARMAPEPGEVCSRLPREKARIMLREALRRLGDE